MKIKGRDLEQKELYRWIWVKLLEASYILDILIRINVFIEELPTVVNGSRNIWYNDSKHR